jgi:hypothetical protein
MPRASELIDETPCPICGEVPPIAEDLEPEPVAPPAPVPEPALPADASELATFRPARNGPRFVPPVGRLGVGLLAGFVLGTAAGICGVFAWQAADAAQNTADNTPPPDTAATTAPPVLPAPAVTNPTAPDGNRTAGYTPAGPQPPASPPEPLPTPSPDPFPPPVVPLQPPPPRGKLTVIDVDAPDGTYAIPFPTRNGEHVVLKGRAKLLRLPAVEGGATVDASGLVAAEIQVGPISGGATVKLNAPEGRVTFLGKIDGKSVVEVNAAGGTVRFPAPAAGQEGAKIDGGSRVTITGKLVAIDTDITGPATRVRVVLTRAGSLRVATVQGTAVLEYRSANSKWSYSDVMVGPVGKGASVVELDLKADAVTDD